VTKCRLLMPSKVLAGVLLFVKDVGVPEAVQSVNVPPGASSKPGSAKYE